MGRLKNEERDGSAEFAGHLWLTEWGNAEQVNIGDFPSANILWKARLGRGGNDGKTPPLPRHLEFVPRAIARLPNMQQVWIANHRYVWHEEHEAIALNLDLSLRTYHRELNTLKIWIASAAKLDIEMPIKTA
jgi:hypothetical protein